MHKSKVPSELNKPAYIGMCVSELSKVLMYEFHYDYIKNKFDNNSKLFITDTDSLMYEIKIEDVGKDFSSNKSMFDFRNYSDILKNYDDSKKTVAIGEFVGLKAKMYSFLVDNNEHKKAKS